MEKPLALVTGGSRGIGAAISERLAKDGFHVVINYNSNEAKAQEVLGSIEKQGGSGEICQFDIANPNQIEEKFKEIHKKFGPLSVLVNNAGISIDALLMRLKDEDLDKVLNTNLKGSIYAARAASRQMMKARKGTIINISSVVGETGNAGQVAYSAAKAGLIGFTKSLAKELASRKIRVNSITPGFITTDMTQALTEEQKEGILRDIPLEEIGRPEDVASLASFLASDQSRYITGQVIGVNGGMYM